VIHAALLVWLLLGGLKAATPPREITPEPVEVAIITEDGLVRLRQGDRSSKNLDAEAKVSPQSDQGKQETPRPKPPPPAAAPPPPPPPPPPPQEAKVEPPPPPPPAPEPKKDPIADKLAMLPKEPEPAPGPSLEEIKRQEEAKRAEELKKQEDARKAAEAKKKADAEKKRLADLKKKQEDEKKRKEAEAKKVAELAKAQSFEDKIEAALNKSALADRDPNRKAPPPANQVANETPSKNKGPIAGAPEGRDNQLTASQAAMLGLMIRQAVSKCWNINAGLDGIDKIVVKIDVQLNPDGTLAQPPKVVNPSSSPLFTDTAASAQRAILQCAPYDFPKDLYKDGWDRSIWTFDPKRMF
jgi:colicin import membrane protein